MYNGFDIKCKLKNIFVNVHYVDTVHITILNLEQEPGKKNDQGYCFLS